MILTTHALTGAIVGKYVSNIWLIVISSFAFHFFFDHLRHGEYISRKSTVKNTCWKVILDLSVGLFVIILIARFSNFSESTIINIFIGAFAAMFPDLLTLLYWKLNLKFLKKLIDFHSWVHKYPLFSPERDWNFNNAINDIIISAIAAAALVFL